GGSELLWVPDTIGKRERWRANPGAGGVGGVTGPGHLRVTRGWTGTSQNRCVSSKPALSGGRTCDPSILGFAQEQGPGVDSQGVVPGIRMASSWPLSPFELSGLSDGPGWGLGVA